MRLLTAICLTALVVAFAMPAFAEVQNIKISGDIGIASVATKDLDLNSRGSATNENDSENFFMQQVGLNVAADLTDNVSTYVRVINERAWDAETQTTSEFDIDLDEAYVTLKEMLYAPLTVKLGRQNIWLGKGLVIGNAGPLVWDKNGALPDIVNEFSDMTAFDAIRATLDYDPWTIDLIYSKIDDEGAADLVNDDTDLYAANVGYKFTKYDAEAEAYYITKHDKSARGDSPSFKANIINTVGLRGSFIPFDNMSVYAEGATQFGKYRTATRQDDRSAYAIDLGGDYTFTDIKWTPKLGLEYLLLSGEDGSATSGEWNAWDPLYRGKFENYIADLRNITKTTDYDTAKGVSANGNSNGMTNEVQIAVLGSLNPMTDVKLDARYAYLYFDEVPVAGNSDKLGQELDGKITYDYTEDVTFTLAGGLFVPGSYYPTDYDESAGQIVTSVKVDF